MNKPTRGLTVAVNVVRVIDGDTVIVALPGSAFTWHVRLIDVWAPEINDRGGKDSLQFVESTLSNANEILLHIPLPEKTTNILSHLTFERIPGYLWIDGECLNDLIVSSGKACKTKRELSLKK